MSHLHRQIPNVIRTATEPSTWPIAAIAFQFIRIRSPTVGLRVRGDFLQTQAIPPAYSGCAVEPVSGDLYCEQAPEGLADGRALYRVGERAKCWKSNLIGCSEISNPSS